jgi:hypothetical protein
VDRVERRGPLRELLLEAQPRRERLGRGEHERADPVDERAHALGTDPLRGRMDRHEPHRMHRGASVAEQLVVRNPELVALTELPVQQDVRALR